MHQLVKELKELINEVHPFSKVKIGDQLGHPSGRKVQITNGQFWGTRGVSNFWYWREVLPDGNLGPDEECGYGWGPN
jgi:hypothetical protein